MKRALAILLFATVAFGQSSLYPPGYKPVVMSPRFAEQQSVKMVKAVAAGPLSPVELRLTRWYVFQGQRIPQPAIYFRTNAPRCTVFSQTENGWSCWTTETNCRAGETREIGWCPTGRDYALWKVMLHD